MHPAMFAETGPSLGLFIHSVVPKQVKFIFSHVFIFLHPRWGPNQYGWN